VLFSSPLDAFLLFINSNLLDIVLQFSNQHLKAVTEESQKNKVEVESYKRSLFRKLKYKVCYNASHSIQNTDSISNPPIWPLINHFDDIGLQINKFMRNKITLSNALRINA